MKRILLALLSCWPLLVSAAPPPTTTEHVRAELLSETDALVPGEARHWVALRLEPDRGWHVYWRNPGDSGFATSLSWQLPAGLANGEIHWPYPTRESLGELTNYGYDDEALHLVPIAVAADLAPGTRQTLQATAKWLVCKDVCIPGSADLALELPVATQAAPINAATFDAARAKLPAAAPEGWKARFAATAQELSLQVDGLDLPASAQIEFFPYASDLVLHSAPQRQAREGSNWRLTQAASSSFVEAPASVDGVLVVRDGRAPVQAYAISAAPGEVIPVPADAAPVALAPEPAGAGVGLAGALLLALLGGLILNLMPCVFPVLSLKALSVMQGARAEARAHRVHALAYTAGVLLSFLVIAALLLALRAGGAAFGWGFQLQSPLFVAALAYVMFALGLSMSGVVHFGTRWMGAGQSLASRPGYGGSFFTGVLAVLVASPCTAPYMGAALGFALAQPAAVGLLVFIALGLGLALPFLLLGFVPRLAALLPRPGAWMETFKQVLAFPLYLTAVWLLWVLGAQTDRNGMAVALVGLVVLAFALWLWGRSRGVFAGVLRYAALALALGLLAHPALRPAAAVATAAVPDADWEPYSDARLAELQAAGRTVLVDFTADWCLTCKVNERVALRSDTARAAFEAHDVALLIGDWTRSDPHITAVLARYGRSGVPLYLVSRNGAEPVMLPQLLTPELVASAVSP